MINFTFVNVLGGLVKEYKASLVDEQLIIQEFEILKYSKVIKTNTFRVNMDCSLSHSKENQLKHYFVRHLEEKIAEQLVKM